MLTTVDLDDQLRLHACEIGDEAADGHLPAKLVSEQGAIPQLRPQPPLGIGHLATKSAGRSDGSHPLTLRASEPDPKGLIGVG